MTSLGFTASDELSYDHQWGRTTFYKPTSCLKNFLKAIVSFSVMPVFSSLQTAINITSEQKFQSADTRITQLQATRYDCSEQYFLRQTRLTRLQKCTQALSEIELNWTFASVFIRAKSKRFEAFRCSGTFQKIRVFCVQGALDKFCRDEPMKLHTNSKPLTKQLDPNECKIFIRDLNVTDGAKTNQYSCNRSFTYLE